MDKMAAILADDNFKCILINDNDGIPIRISLKCVPMKLIGNKPNLVQCNGLAPNMQNDVVEDNNINQNLYD